MTLHYEQVPKNMASGMVDNTCTCDKNALNVTVQAHVQEWRQAISFTYTLQSLVTSRHAPSSDMDQRKVYIITRNCYMMVFALYGMSGMSNVFLLLSNSIE